MPTLHILNTSPHMSSALESCLSVLQKNDGIIFIEDAVISTIKETQIEPLLKEKKCFVLKPDLDARGIKLENLIQYVEQVDYNGFVKLTIEYDRTHTWN